MGAFTYRRLTAQKTKFSIKDFFSKCELLKKSLMENLIFCAASFLKKKNE